MSGSNMGGTKPCPVPGCRTKRGVNQIMCTKHWARVPWLQRHDVWNSRGALRSGAIGAAVETPGLTTAEQT